MKLPSFDKLARDAGATFVRFPLVILAGVFSACVIWSRTDDHRFAMVGFLGISFLYAIAIFVERRTHNRAVRIAAGLAGIAVLVAYFLTIPPEPFLNDVHGMRYALFALVAHLLAAFAPFTRRNELNGFWQYNKALFIRILSTGLFTGVLYLGLVLALLAIRQLFDVDFNDRVFGDLAGLLAGVFATWFFLAGVPPDLAALEGVNAYPGGLKIFTQYVLLPLVTIYLVILYVYAGKILVTWELPIGWASGLILGLAVVGILSLLLLYPIRNLEGNAWIRQFNAWLYRLIAPLLVLLFLAIGRRVGDYGITEPRYFVWALAIWLAGITLYFVIRRGDNIKIIPITLAIVAFFSSFGPWGAFQVSIQSQARHLRDVLVANKGLVDGKIVRLGDTLESTKNYDILSIVAYLDKRGAVDELRQWAPGAPSPLTQDTLLALLGMGAYRSIGPSNRRLTVSAGNDNLTRVTGFDYALRFAASASYHADPELVGADSLHLWVSGDQRGLLVWAGADSALFNVTGGLKPVVDSLVRADSLQQGSKDYFEVRPGTLVADAVWRGRPARIVITSAGLVRIAGKEYKLESVGGTLLLGDTSAPSAPAP